MVQNQGAQGQGLEDGGIDVHGQGLGIDLDTIGDPGPILEGHGQDLSLHVLDDHDQETNAEGQRIVRKADQDLALEENIPEDQPLGGEHGPSLNLIHHDQEVKGPDRQENPKIETGKKKKTKRVKM